MTALDDANYNYNFVKQYMKNRKGDYNQEFVDGILESVDRQINLSTANSLASIAESLKIIASQAGGKDVLKVDLNGPPDFEEFGR